MLELKPGDTIAVRVGETFKLVYRDLASSGYETRLELPAAVERMETVSIPAKGFGGTKRVVEALRCKHAGEYRIEVSQKRRWEPEADRRWATVRCTESDRNG